MKKLFSRILALLTVLLLLFLCACGAENGAAPGKLAADEAALQPKQGDAVSVEGTSADNRKIVQTWFYDVETKEFDTYVEGIKTEAAKAGGYIESMNIRGTEMRSASFVVRIPADKDVEFRSFAEENGSVTNQRVTTEDVTLQYVDVESRLSSLRQEQEKLESFLKEADNLADMITVQNQLTDVIYEIETYEAQLRTLAARVEFTTINLEVTEVERVKPAEQSVWEEMGENLAENFKGVGHFLVRLFVFLVSALPYLLLLGVVFLAIFLPIRISCVKKKKRKKSE